MADTFKMTVDINVLHHLGIKLYSDIAAVLTDAVARWNADAQKAGIRIDPVAKPLATADDCVGMSVADKNDKYLRVGYQHRDETYGRVMPKGRPVMGRKRRRKLSLVSISNTIDVHSTNNRAAHGLRTTVSGCTHRTCI